MDIPRIYLVYSQNMFSEQNLVFIPSNTYIALVSMFCVQDDAVVGWRAYPSMLFDGKENSGI
jgi:hypothetical protein